MALNYGLKVLGPSSDETKPHVLAYTVARSSATALLVDLWNAATSAGRKFAVDLNGKPVSAAYTAGDLLYATTGVIAGVRRVDGLALGTSLQLLRVNVGATAPEYFSLTAAHVGAGTFTGSFTFASTLTASITGNAGGSSASCTGLAATATALATPRAINGTNFDGTAPITVTAAAGTLTGTTLNATVVTSSLTSVGTLSAGAVPVSLVTAGTFGTGNYVINGALLSVGANTVANAFRAWVTGDTQYRFLVTSAGKVLWGDGANGPDVTMERTGAGAISILGDISLNGHFNVGSGKVYKVNGAQVLGAQGAAVADATDAASTQARLNDLLARCRAHGLIAT